MLYWNEQQCSQWVQIEVKCIAAKLAFFSILVFRKNNLFFGVLSAFLSYAACEPISFDSGGTGTLDTRTNPWLLYQELRSSLYDVYFYSIFFCDATSWPIIVATWGFICDIL